MHEDRRAADLATTTPVRTPSKAAPSQYRRSSPTTPPHEDHDRIGNPIDDLYELVNPPLQYLPVCGWAEVVHRVRSGCGHMYLQNSANVHFGCLAISCPPAIKSG